MSLSKCDTNVFINAKKVIICVILAEEEEGCQKSSHPGCSTSNKCDSLLSEPLCFVQVFYPHAFPLFTLDFDQFSYFYSALCA